MPNTAQQGDHRIDALSSADSWVSAVQAVPYSVARAVKDSDETVQLSALAQSRLFLIFVHGMAAGKVTRNCREVPSQSWFDRLPVYSRYKEYSGPHSPCRHMYLSLLLPSGHLSFSSHRRFSQLFLYILPFSLLLAILFCLDRLHLLCFRDDTFTLSISFFFPFILSSQ